MNYFAGRWKITWMEMWGQDYVDLVEPGYFLFDEDNQGEFVFSVVHGWLDVRVSTRQPMLEYSWQGDSEGDPLCGRGVFDFPDTANGEGILYIHNSDESAIKIARLKP
jgi:hypothetical protein